MTAIYLAVGIAIGVTAAYGMAAGDYRRQIPAHRIVDSLGGAALGAIVGAGFCVLLFGIAPA